MSSTNAKISAVEKKVLKAETPKFNVGDTVRVHVRIKEGDKERIQMYEGVVMGFQNSGSRKAFIVRKISHGVGVERVFPIHSPVVAKVDVMVEGRVRRAKLGYLRGLTGKAAKVRNVSEMQ